MEQPADFTISTATDRPTVALTGDWTAPHLGAAGANLGRALRGLGEADFDLRGARRMDTAGAYAVVRAAGGGLDPGRIKVRREARRLLELVAYAV